MGLGQRGPGAQTPGQEREPVGCSHCSLGRVWPPTPKQTFHRPLPAPQPPPCLRESATARAHTCAVRAQDRADEQEESAARRAAGPVNWQLRGRLVAGARRRRGQRLPTPAPTPIRADGKMGGALHCGWTGGGGAGGLGTRYSKAILCLEKGGQSAFSPRGPESPTPSRRHPTQDIHWAASSASPGCSGLESALSGAEVGIGDAQGWVGTGPGLAGGASWVSGDSEDSRHGWLMG